MKLVRTILAGILLVAMMLPLVSCTPLMITPVVEETETEETETRQVQQQVEVPTTKKYKIRELEGYLKLIGERTDFAANDLLPLEWVGSGFELKFEAPAGGTSVTMSTRFNYESRYVIFVDGVRQEEFLAPGKGNVDSIIATVGEGVHTVRVEKDTEAGTVHNNYNNIVSLSFDGTPMIADQEEKEYFFDFIGDGYFVGFGNLGNQPASATISKESSFHSALPYLTSQAMNADYSVVAHTKIGLLTSNGKKNLLQLYGNQNGYRDADLLYSPTRIPDAIIIHAGLDDSASKLPAGNFVLSAETFIETVRSYYGEEGADIPVIWLYGTLYYTKRASEIKALQARNDNVYAVQCEYGQNGSGAKDTVRYPSAEDHQKSADVLVEFLEGLLSQEELVPEETPVVEEDA